MGRTKKLFNHMRESELHKQLHFEEQEYLYYVRCKQIEDRDNKDKQQ